MGWVCLSARGEGIHLDVLQTHHGKGPAVLWQLLSSQQSGFYGSDTTQRDHLSAAALALARCHGTCVTLCTGKRHTLTILVAH